jgi:hypothetical protein
MFCHFAYYKGSCLLIMFLFLSSPVQYDGFYFFRAFHVLKLSAEKCGFFTDYRKPGRWIYKWFIRGGIRLAADKSDAMSELQNRQLLGYLQWIGTIAKSPS